MPQINAEAADRKNIRNNPRSSAAQAAAATGGVGLGVLLATVLGKYPGIVQQIVGWGPALLVIGLGYMAVEKYGPALIESHQANALALAKLADTVDRTSNNQHDLVLAMQVNSDKLEQLRATVSDLQEYMKGSSNGR